LPRLIKCLYAGLIIFLFAGQFAHTRESCTQIEQGNSVVRVGFGFSVCQGCHVQARANDYVFTKR
jgi:hypothetical protein